jgi:hypothetical protein
MRQFKYEIGQMVYYKNMPNEIVNRYYDNVQESNAYDLVCKLNGHSSEPRVYIEIKEDVILDARPKFARKNKNKEQNFSEGNTQQSNGQTLIQSFISSDLLKKLEVIINHHYNQIMPKFKIEGGVDFVNYPTRPEIMFGNTSNVISFVKKYKSKIMRMGLYNYITVDGNINDVKKQLEEFARIRETKSFRFHVEIKTHTKCKIIRVK